MTAIKLNTAQQTPETFEPKQGQVFQVYENRETVLVMYTDDCGIITLTGRDAGYVGSREDVALSRENLVDTLELIATLSPIV